MKKNIIILLFILAGTLCFILLLIGRSDPERLVIDVPRRYNGIYASPEDTIRFKVTLNAIETDGNIIYGYANKEKILCRYDPESRKMDTLLHTRSFLSGILSGVDRDPATNTFYFFSANTNRIYLFHPQDSSRDSLDEGHTHLAGGEKCLTGTYFLIRSTDSATSLTSLKKADYIRHTDTTIYTFTHYHDGGISADGFFRKDLSSKKLFYIPYYNAEIIQYDEVNNKISKIITIDKTMPYNSTIPTEQGYTISSKARMINITATTDSAHLFLLSNTSSKGKKEPSGTVIDVYSTVTGSYEYSLQFPYFEGYPVTLLKKSGDKLFVAFGNNILSYKIEYR